MPVRQETARNPSGRASTSSAAATLAAEGVSQDRAIRTHLGVGIRRRTREELTNADFALLPPELARRRRQPCRGASGASGSSLSNGHQPVAPA